MNNCLMLGAGDTFGINGCFGAPKKNFSINFSKAMTKVYIIMLMVVIFLLTEKKCLMGT